MTQKLRDEKLEKDFERKCMQLLKAENWAAMDAVSTEHLENTSGKSFKGFFFLGVSLYKQGDYENSIRAFTKAEFLCSDDA